MLVKQNCSYCGSSHPPRQCLAYGKECVGEAKRNRTVHDLDQEPDQHHKEEDHIDTVNTNHYFW